jgi:hypothetical protein
MADLIVEAMTNTTPNSVVKVTLTCDTMWSLVQQFCYLRLSDATGHFKARLVQDSAVRARRIAAVYARFYLELEDGCKPELQGRFYWMALAAFASKTVACSLETTRVSMLSAVKDGLGQGNLWLFMDIAGWHHYYCKYGNSFEICRDKRNTNELETAVIKATKTLPWAEQALPRIRHLGVTPEIKKAFALVPQIEKEKDDAIRRAFQLKHLLAIAQHEQERILQPLIYDDPPFKAWVQRQRNLRWISPALELVFSHECSTDKEELKSVAPSDTELEKLKSRMKWITAAAGQFHKLMDGKKDYMQGEIKTMAGWVNLPDKT